MTAQMCTPIIIGKTKSILKQNAKFTGLRPRQGPRVIAGGARGWHFHAKEPLLGDGIDALCRNF